MKFGILISLALGSLLCSASALVAGTPTSTGPTVVSKLEEGETLGREIRIEYSTFEDRLVLQQALVSAKKEARKQGIERIYVLGATGSAPTRLSLMRRFTVKPVSTWYTGELIVYEVVSAKKA